VDNDNNTFTDCLDFGCAFAPNCESDDEQCSDKEDNDGDGFFDCEDIGCSQNKDVTVCPDR